MEAVKSLLKAIKALFVKLFGIFKTKSTEQAQVVQDKVQDVKDQVQDKVQEVADKVQDVADNVK